LPLATSRPAARFRIRGSILALLLAVGCAQETTAQSEARAPVRNVVVFMVDDMGWRDPAFQGGTYHRTPRMDALAQRGVTFSNAYSCGPNCAPSRACWMSGQLSPRHGVYTVGSAQRGRSADRALVPTPNRRDLADEILTLAESLRGAGLRTGHFGKWHLGADPTNQGFDVNVGGGPAGHPKSYFSPYRNPALADGPDGECLTDRLAAEAVRFVERHASERFFLHLSFFAVHTPIQAKPALTAEYRERPTTTLHQNPKYAAMVETTDQAIGAVLDALQRLELTEQTLIVFTSDNGGHGPVTSMAPLRGAKGMLYEGGIRVPLVVCWPGVAAPAGRCAVPVQHVDLYPTILAAVGAAAPDQPLDGIDLRRWLAAPATAAPERALFWHFPAYLEAAGPRRAGATAWRTTPVGAIRDGDLKLLEFFEDGRLELFDLARDEGELINLAEIQPDDARRLHEQLRAWRQSVDAPVPTERNPDYAGG